MKRVVVTAAVARVRAVPMAMAATSEEGSNGSNAYTAPGDLN